MSGALTLGWFGLPALGVVGTAVALVICQGCAAAWLAMLLVRGRGRLRRRSTGSSARARRCISPVREPAAWPCRSLRLSPGSWWSRGSERWPFPLAGTFDRAVHRRCGGPDPHGSRAGALSAGSGLARGLRSWTNGVTTMPGTARRNDGARPARRRPGPEPAPEPQPRGSSSAISRRNGTSSPVTGGPSSSSA